jgi:hypothetical protein
VETTSARGLDLTPENVSKPDLKRVGLLFHCPRLARGSAVEHPSTHHAASVRRTPQARRNRSSARFGWLPSSGRTYVKLVVGSSGSRHSEERSNPQSNHRTATGMLCSYDTHTDQCIPASPAGARPFAICRPTHEPVLEPGYLKTQAALVAKTKMPD